MLIRGPRGVRTPSASRTVERNGRARPRPCYSFSVDGEKFAPDQHLAGVLARFARAVRERFAESVVDIRLFGSHARANAHEDSDVDVAVVLEAAGWEVRRDIIDLAADIGLAHDLMLSPTVFDRATYERWRAQDRPLVRDIETEGIPV